MKEYYCLRQLRVIIIVIIKTKNMKTKIMIFQVRVNVVISFDSLLLLVVGCMLCILLNFREYRTCCAFICNHRPSRYSKRVMLDTHL